VGEQHAADVGTERAGQLGPSTGREQIHEGEVEAAAPGRGARGGRSGHAHEVVLGRHQQAEGADVPGVSLHDEDGPGIAHGPLA
jgi:hypothetical protein